MANILDKYNEHLFLEHTANSSNSFIANVNRLASKFDELTSIDKKFDAESVKLLVQLVKNALDINIKQIADDLRKGSYEGYRKLDINLLTNFSEYDELMTDSEKNSLWNDPTKQVYYSSVDVIFKNGTTIHKDFNSDINNHHQLYTELINWEEFTENYGDTLVNISADTPIYNHELLRIVDSSMQGSAVESVILHVALTGKDPAYDAVFAGAKSHNPKFSWMDTTSALITIANRVNEVINTADYIESLGTDMRTMFEEYVAQVQEYIDIVAGYAADSAENAEKVEDAVNKQLDLTVATVVQPALTDPTVAYNPVSNIMTFGLPRSEIAVVGLSRFAIDTANGHLSFETINDEDVENVYINEDGNVIIEMK